VDHVADVARGGYELLRLLQLYPPPEYVKTAEVDTALRVPDEMPLSAAADPVRGQFYCNTKAASWLSYLFYLEKQGEFHPKDRAPIQARLDAFVAKQGIAADCDALKARWHELNKNAEEQLPDDTYAFVWVGENGSKIRQYPLRSALEVKTAADWLLQYRDETPYENRHVIAKKILTKAAQFGARLPEERTEFLERQAGRGVCEPSEVVSMLRQRAAQVRDPELRGAFQKMAQTVSDLPRAALGPPTMIKLAETVDKLDRSLGWVQRYGRDLPRPDEVIFKATFGKTASALAEHVATTTGRVYEKAAFRKLAVADVSALFGDDFAAQVSTPFGEVDPEKMAELASTLPRPDAALFDTLLAENGIIPAMRAAAAVKQGHDMETMTAIAELYGRVG
jgi:hypothetical protein